MVENSQGSRRERNKQDKRERIREAAWGLFTEQGYEATTTKAVAARARVAKGTLFLYASDKPDLLFMVFRERIRSTVESAFSSLPEGPLPEQLLHIFAALFAMYAQHPEVARDFLKVLPGARGINADAGQSYTFTFVAQLAMLVSRACARGEVSADVEPMVAASNIFSLYFGALLSWLNGYVAIEHACSVVLARSLELQMRGLAPR